MLSSRPILQHLNIAASCTWFVQCQLRSSAVTAKVLSPLDRKIIQRHKQAVHQNKDTYEDPVTGYNVFTKTYHLNRGECCASACRHVSDYLF